MRFRRLGARSARTPRAILAAAAVALLCLSFGHADPAAGQVPTALAWPDEGLVADVRALLLTYYNQEAAPNASPDDIAPVDPARLAAAPKDPDMLWESLGGRVDPRVDVSPACHAAQGAGAFVDCTGARLALGLARPYRGGLSLFGAGSPYASGEMLVFTAGHYALYHAFVIEHDADRADVPAPTTGRGPRDHKPYHAALLRAYEAHMRDALVKMLRDRRDDAPFQASLTRSAGWLLLPYARTANALERHRAWAAPADRRDALAVVNALSQRIWWEWVQAQPAGPRTAGFADLGSRATYDAAVARDPGQAGTQRFTVAGQTIESLRAAAVDAGPHDGLWFDADFTLPGEWYCAQFGYDAQDGRACMAHARRLSLGGQNSPFGGYYGAGSCGQRAGAPTAFACGETNLGSSAEEWLGTYVGARAGLRLIDLVARAGDPAAPAGAIGPGGHAAVAERLGFGVAGWHGGEGYQDDMEWPWAPAGVQAIRTLSAGRHDTERQNGRLSLGEDSTSASSTALDGDTWSGGGAESPGAIENHMPGPNPLYGSVIFGQVLDDKADAALAPSLYDAVHRNHPDEFAAWVWLLQSTYYRCLAGADPADPACFAFGSPLRKPLFVDPTDTAVPLAVRYLWRDRDVALPTDSVASGSTHGRDGPGLPWVAVPTCGSGAPSGYLTTEWGFGAYNLLLQGAGGFMRVAAARTAEAPPPGFEASYADANTDVLTPWYGEMRRLAREIVRMYRTPANGYGYVPDIEHGRCLGPSGQPLTWRAATGDVLATAVARRAHWYSIAANWYWWYDSRWLAVDAATWNPASASPTPSRSPTATASPRPTTTVTSSPSRTSTRTATATPTPTTRPTPSATPDGPAPATSAASPSATRPPSATATSTPVGPGTATATREPTSTPVPSSTAGATPTRPATTTPTSPPQPGTCAADLIPNGGFESGFEGWRWDGQAQLRFVDRTGTGTSSAMLTGRNDTRATLIHDLPDTPGTTHHWVSLWWKVESEEPASATRPEDWMALVWYDEHGVKTRLEMVSNLARRGTWRISGYRLPANVAAIGFEAGSNRRDPTEFYVDDVRVEGCSGGQPWPDVQLYPSQAVAGSALTISASHFAPGDTVAAWLLEPSTRHRIEAAIRVAGPTGGWGAETVARAPAGPWELAAAETLRGHAAAAAFEVIAAAAPGRSPARGTDHTDRTDQSTTLGFVPPAATVRVGDTLELDLRLADVRDLYAGQVEVTYDPAVLEIVDQNALQPGIQVTPGDFVAPFSTTRNVVDTVNHKILFTFSRVGAQPGVSGSGTVVRVTVRGLGAGTSALGLAGTLLSDPNSREIARVATDGAVTVVSGQPGTPPTPPTATRTATPSPTVARTATATATRTATPRTPGPTLPPATPSGPAPGWATPGGILPTGPVRAVAVDASGTVWFRVAAGAGAPDTVTAIGPDGRRRDHASQRAAVAADPAAIVAGGTMPEFWAVAADGSVWVGAARFDGAAWRTLRPDVAGAGGDVRHAERVVVDRGDRAWVPFASASPCGGLAACATDGVVGIDAGGGAGGDVLLPRRAEPGALGVPAVRLEDRLAVGGVALVGPEGAWFPPDRTLHPIPDVARSAAMGRAGFGWITASTRRPDGRLQVFAVVEAAGGLGTYRPTSYTWTGGGWQAEPLAGMPLADDAATYPIPIVAAAYDAQGALWIATRRGEIAVREGARWTRTFTSANSPLAAPIASIAAGAGALWVGTERGALRYAGAAGGLAYLPRLSRMSP